MATTYNIRGTLQIKKDNTTPCQFPINYSQEITKQSSKTLIISGPTADQVIDLSDIANVTVLTIISDKDITLKLNSAATATSAGKFFVFTGTTTAPITALSITNALSENAIIQIIAGGN